MENSWKTIFLKKIFEDPEAEKGIIKLRQTDYNIKYLAMNIHQFGLSDLIRGHYETDRYFPRIMDFLASSIGHNHSIILFNVSKIKLRQKFDFAFFFDPEYEIHGPITDIMYQLIPAKVKENTMLIPPVPKKWKVRQDRLAKTVAELKEMQKPPFIYVKAGSYYYAYVCRPSALKDFDAYLNSFFVKHKIVR